MKKSIRRTTAELAALAAILALSSCGAKPAETTTAAPAETTTTAAAETTTTAAETTTAAPETTEPATEETAGADNSGKTVMFTDTSDHNYYVEDAKEGEWDMTFPYASVRLSSGLYVDSDTSPELFDVENFRYNGDRVQRGDLVMIKPGDTVGGLTIADAETKVFKTEENAVDEGENPLSPQISDVRVTVGGEVTLTGIIRYYYDEMYAVASGDIMFVPDSSYAGMPVGTNIVEGDWEYGTVNFDEKGSSTPDGGYGDNTYGGGVNVYSDAPLLHLGNLNENYSDRTDLVELFDGASANCTKKVSITLTDLVIDWNDMFGSAYSCSGVIKDLTVIG